MLRFFMGMVLIVVLSLMLTSETQHRFQVYAQAEEKHELSFGQLHPPRFKVCVQVNGDDETLTGLITSNLKKELRALGDVDIVGFVDAWQFLISVRYLEGKFADGTRIGWIAIAHDVLARAPDFLFHAKPAFPAVYASSNASHIGVGYWHRDQLQQWCVLQADNFNNKYLKVPRLAIKQEQNKK